MTSSKNHSQHGVVLIMALIFLIMLTLIGLAMVGSTNLEEKIARNSRDQDIAYAAAEATLRDAIIRIDGSYKWPYNPVKQIDFDSSCTNGLCDSTLAQPIDAQDFFGSTAPGSNSVTIGTLNTGDTPTSPPATPNIQGVAAQPRYVIELICTQLGGMTGNTCNKIFRITVQAQGRSADTRVVLQQMYLPASLVP